MACNERQTYYYDPATGERVKATYLITLVVPTNYIGQIEIDAESEEEAARMALEKAYEIEWECPRLKLHGMEIEVLDIECDEPPEGAVLFRPIGSIGNDQANCADNHAPLPPKEGGQR